MEFGALTSNPHCNKADGSEGGGGGGPARPAKDSRPISVRILDGELQLANVFVQKKRRGAGGSTAAASKTKSKGGVSSETASAFSLFESIYEQHKDCVAALLGLAMLFTVEGQDQKARNMLKQIVKKPYQVSPSCQG